jgi:hypothetical protein
MALIAQIALGVIIGGLTIVLFVVGFDSTVSCRLSGSERGAALPWPGVPAGMASPRLDRLNC